MGIVPLLKVLPPSLLVELELESNPLLMLGLVPLLMLLALMVFCGLEFVFCAVELPVVLEIS